MSITEFSKIVELTVPFSVASFAGKLHPKLNESTENSFYSPFSILVALGMCNEGARGKTQETLIRLLEIPTTPTCKVLDYDHSLPSLENQEFFKNLLIETKKYSNNESYELTVANALWADQTVTLNENYQKTIASNYQGSLNQVDYLQDPISAVEKINSWCNTNTNGKIKKIIDNDVKGDTRLIITNAIYFKGKWAKQFNEKWTSNKTFATPNGDKLVKMMYQSDEFKYGETEDFQALELPYQGDDLSMLIILPTEKTTEKLDTNLKNAYNRANESLGNYPVKVDVNLPKFKMETSFDLKETFSDLGAEIIFSDSADFSGISNESLKISSIIHKAFVQVDEEGTEAAAVTSVGMNLCRAARPRQFNVNRPALFFIKSKENTILFAGRLTDPTV